MDSRPCPIYNSEMVVSSHGAYCENKCYSVAKTGYVEYVYVFGEGFEFSLEYHSEYLSRLEKELHNKIAYWKDNEKYLMNLMGV